jgi:hypothetical protein
MVEMVALLDIRVFLSGVDRRFQVPGLSVQKTAAAREWKLLPTPFAAAAARLVVR